MQDEDSDSAGQQAGPGSGDVAPVNDLATRRLAARESNSNRDDASRRRNETTRTHHETARNETTTHDTRRDRTGPSRSDPGEPPRRSRARRASSTLRPAATRLSPGPGGTHDRSRPWARAAVCSEGKQSSPSEAGGLVRVLILAVDDEVVLDKLVEHSKRTVDFVDVPAHAPRDLIGRYELALAPALISQLGDTPQ